MCSPPFSSGIQDLKPRTCSARLFNSLWSSNMPVDLFLTHCRIDSFRVLRQSFCGKFEFSAEFSSKLSQFFGCMWTGASKSSQTISNAYWSVIAREQVQVHVRKFGQDFYSICCIQVSIVEPFLLGLCLKPIQWKETTMQSKDLVCGLKQRVAYNTIHYNTTGCLATPRQTAKGNSFP